MTVRVTSMATNTKLLLLEYTDAAAATGESTRKPALIHAGPAAARAA